MCLKRLVAKRWGLLACAALIACLALPALAVDYTVTTVSSDGVQNLHLGSTGELTFNLYSGIALYSGGRLTNIAPSERNYAAPFLNASGQVTFWGWPDDTSHGGIWLYDPVTGTRNITDAYTARYPRIHDSGTIVWKESGGVKKYQDGQITVVANDGNYPKIGSGGHIAWVTSGGQLQITDGNSVVTLPETVQYAWKFNINSAGHVVYVARDGLGHATYVYDGTQTLRVGGSSQSCAEPKINDRGDVLFSLEDGPDSVLVLRRASGATTELFRASWYSVQNFDLNNLGNYAYHTSTGSLEVFLGQERVHMTPNYGCTGDINLNDQNMVAWIGGHAAYLAVPEPAMLSLLVLGGLALIRRRKK